MSASWGSSWGTSWGGAWGASADTSVIVGDARIVLTSASVLSLVRAPSYAERAIHEFPPELGLFTLFGKD